MAGEAITTEFMLGTAAVMLGSMTNLYDFTPVNNSLGLVKSVKLTVNPTFVELAQGLRNQVVYSVKTQNVSKITFDLYEYTGRNLAYALGLASSDYSIVTPVISLTTAIAAISATSVIVTSGTGFTVGSWVMITDNAAVPARTVARLISAIVTNTLSFVRPLPAAFASGSEVRQPKNLAFGASATQPYLGCKVAGLTAEGNPVQFMFGKVRVTSDFTLGFQTNDYASVPMELSVYDLVSTDANYADFSAQQGYMFIS